MREIINGKREEKKEEEIQKEKEENSPRCQ